MTNPEHNKYHRDTMQSVEYGDGDFYVYIHFRRDNGLPFYVGKGMRNGRYDRMKESGCRRNEYWNRIMNKHGYTAKVIRNCGSDEELAHHYEMELIGIFRGIGFELTNLTDGGDGCSGRVPSDETRRKLSEANLGKTLSDEHRQKISEASSGENHPNWGKTLSDETRQKISEATLGKSVSNDSKLKMSEAKSGENHPKFKGYSIGYNDSQIIIFCGNKDMKSRGFNSGHIAQSILKNPKIKSHKGYVFIRTDSPADIYPLLETRTFADEKSITHWEYFQTNYKEYT